MAAAKDLAPKTNCIMEEHKFGVACDEYFKTDPETGNIFKDYSCCSVCGWNPFEQIRRLKKLENKGAR